MVFDWPACTFETRPWTSPRVSGNYQAAVPPLIADAQPTLAPRLQATIEDASTELARFDTETSHNPAPRTTILLHAEAVSSSEIENITASVKQVALADLGAPASVDAKLVASNVHAMCVALQFADDLNTDTIIQAQQALLEETAPELTGHFRTQQVWIGGGSFSPHEAQFVPPHHERVPALMDDLIEFCARTDIPALAHAAIAHAQFETIHPFPDGNGRTGRALIHSMLKRASLTRNITVPLSAGFLRDTRRYFDALTAYRAGSLDEMIEVVADAVHMAIENSRMLVRELTKVSDRWESIPTRQGSAGRNLKTLLLAQPVVTAKLVASDLGVTTVTAQTAIDTLVTGGALKQTKSGKRNRIWHAPEVLEALDGFGDRARRW